MFQSCYRGHVPTEISRTPLNGTSAYRRPAPGQSRSDALDVAGELLGQLSDPSGVNHIDDILAVAHTCRWVGLHQTRFGEKIKVSVQAWSAHIHRTLQPSNGRRAEHRQTAQDIYPGTVAHKTDCHFNFGRHFGSNQAWHGSILPDALANQCLFCRPTLLLSNRVYSGLSLWPA